MDDSMQPQRRQFLGLIAATAAATTLGSTVAQAAHCEHDGTPLQFVPKTAPDPKPLENELAKYPTCPYCGMSRKQYDFSRHLIHYQDQVVDATCSIHCAAVSLSLNLDRGPMAIYAADFASKDTPKAMLNVDDATYLIGSKLPAVMSTQSKMAFADKATARTAQQEQGGELGDFNVALAATYQGMAQDTKMIRQKRADKKAQAKKDEHGH